MLSWFLARSARYKKWLIVSILLIPIVQGFRLVKPIILKWILEAVESHGGLEHALELS